MHQDKEWLYQKYIVEGLDCVQIGKMVNRDTKTIWYWLKKFDIPTRPRGTNWQANGLNKGRSKGWHHTKEAKEKVGKASRERGAVPYRSSKNGKHWLKDRPAKDNPNWKGGITPERQEFSNSDEWKEATNTIWKRDNATCQRCNKKYNNKKHKPFHVHHIVSFKVKELRTELSNLILLCRPCHYWIHSNKNTEKEFIKEWKV